jgi:hypothetical protein
MMDRISGLRCVAVAMACAALGCGDSSSPGQRLADAYNRVARERCECLYADRGYTSARECREAESVMRPPQHRCEGEAYRADETGLVRGGVECQADVMNAQADCYGQTGCDATAFQDCDIEAAVALSECPQPTVEAMEAYSIALQACLTGASPPSLGDCPNDDIGSVVGTPAYTGTTRGSHNDLGGSCGGALTPDEALQWVAPQTGTVTINTFGTDFDTILYVLEGSCTGPELVCNDDAPGAPGWQSEVTLEVTEGDVLIIVVDGWGPGDEGPFQLNIEY